MSDGDGPKVPDSSLPLMVAADLQDHLMMVSHDLDRLKRLLVHSCETMLESFDSASQQLHCLRAAPDAPVGAPQALDAVLADLAKAVVALQFDDMASQLITHAHHRLQVCTDKLASATFADDEDGKGVIDEASMRPNPVTQDEMDAGSVELF